MSTDSDAIFEVSVLTVVVVLVVVVDGGEDREIPAI